MERRINEASCLELAFSAFEYAAISRSYHQCEQSLVRMLESFFILQAFDCPNYKSRPLRNCLDRGF